MKQHIGCNMLFDDGDANILSGKKSEALQCCQASESIYMYVVLVNTKSFLLVMLTYVC